MKVQVWVELRGEETLEQFRMFGGNESVADVFANDGSVLAFDQSVVGGSVGARLGELDQQLVQHL